MCVFCVLSHLVFCPLCFLFLLLLEACFFACGLCPCLLAFLSPAPLVTLINSPLLRCWFPIPAFLILVALYLRMFQVPPSSVAPLPADSSSCPIGDQNANLLPVHQISHDDFLPGPQLSPISDRSSNSDPSGKGKVPL